MSDVSYNVISDQLIDGKTTMEINGDWRGYGAIVGLKLPFICDFSRFFLRQQSQGDYRPPLNSGKLNIKQGWLNLFKSGGVYVDVKDTQSNSMATYKYTTRWLGTRSAALEKRPIMDVPERWVFPLVGINESLYVTARSDEPSPLCIVGTGFKGDYNNDAQDV